VHHAAAKTSILQENYWTQQGIAAATTCNGHGQQGWLQGVRQRDFKKKTKESGGFLTKPPDS